MYGEDIVWTCVYHNDTRQTSGQREEPFLTEYRSERESLGGITMPLSWFPSRADLLRMMIQDGRLLCKNKTLLDHPANHQRTNNDPNNISAPNNSDKKPGKLSRFSIALPSILPLLNLCARSCTVEDDCSDFALRSTIAAILDRVII